MIYLIVNNSYHIIDDEVAKIVGNREYQIIDYLKTDMYSLVNEANYTDLFSSEKILVVKNCIFLGSKDKIDTKPLEKYLANPNSLTTLILTYNGTIDERKKIIKQIKENYHYKIIKPLYHKDIVDKLLTMIKQKGFRIKLEDLEYLVDCSLNNYDVAYNEVEKIFLYYNKACEIESKDVRKLVSFTLEDNNFKFVDAVIQNNFNMALAILKDFKIAKVEAIALVNLLAREYRLMLLVKELSVSGLSSRDMGVKLNLADWQVNKAIKNSYNFTNKDLEKELIKLCELDYKMKRGLIDKYLGLEMYILGK